MNDNDNQARLDRMRRAFDRAFQEAFIERDYDVTHLLKIRVATEGFALRVSDLAGLGRAPAIVAVPSAIPGLLGLAGVKGRLVSVYSLALLCGCQRAEGGRDSWSVLCRGDDRVALVFTAAEGTLMAPRSELYPVSQGAPAHVSNRVGAGAERRWLLDIASLVETVAMHNRNPIAELAGPAAPAAKPSEPPTTKQAA